MLPNVDEFNLLHESIRIAVNMYIESLPESRRHLMSQYEAIEHQKSLYLPIRTMSYTKEMSSAIIIYVET